MKETKASIFRRLLTQSDPIVAPGVFDGLTARMAELAGFSAIYASGGAMARSCGYPDIGLMTLTEITERLTVMTEVTNVPIIADADTGFGNSINVQRTVRLFEKAGVAAFHIEDQEFPKRCGHLDGKTLVSTAEMCQKIAAAKDALNDKDIVIIARTDAIAVEGFDAAIKRAKAYEAAGADAIFVEAPINLEQIEIIGKEVSVHPLINMFYSGKTPLVPLEDLKRMGYKIVIIPSDLQRAAIRAVELTLQEIKKTGNSAALSGSLASFNDRELIVRTTDYLTLDENLGKRFK